MRSASPGVAVGVLNPKFSIGVIAAPNGSVEASFEVVLVNVHLGGAVALDGEGGPVSVVKVLPVSLFSEEGVEVAA